MKNNSIFSRSRLNILHSYHRNIWTLFFIKRINIIGEVIDNIHFQKTYRSINYVNCCSSINLMTPSILIPLYLFFQIFVTHVILYYVLSQPTRTLQGLPVGGVFQGLPVGGVFGGGVIWPLSTRSLCSNHSTLK